MKQQVFGSFTPPFGYLPPGDAALTAFAHGGNPQDHNASLATTEPHLR
ncbi:MAG: hypothetical protein AAFY76_05490 [Cyanobacteria bacterium J06649_11]